MHTCDPPSEKLEEFFENFPQIKEDFGHILLLQKLPDDGTLSEAMVPYFESAHLDARKKIHKSAGIDLHPDADDDEPIIEYPQSLPSKTRRGLFGEVMAGLVTEEYGEKFVGEYNWRVPVFLFREHDALRIYLFDLVRGGESTKANIGRFGSDFIGINLNEKREVARIIVGEAKWTKILYRSVVDNLMNGKKISDPTNPENKIHDGKGVWNLFNKYKYKSVPSGLRQLTDILIETDQGKYAKAILSMEDVLLLKNKLDLPRTDLIVLVGNGSSSRGLMDCLLPRDEKPDDYTAGNNLQLVEVIMKEGVELIDAIYDNLWKNGENDD